MAEQVDIKDYESARAWLETQEHQAQVWFAARCALRALPGLGTWADATSSGLAFATCRALLISAAASTCPAAEMRELESAADSAARSALSARSAARSALSADSAALSARSAARSALSAALSAARSADSAARSADSAALSARSAALSARSAAATFDAKNPKTWDKLWPDAPQPDGLAQAWDALKAQWKADGPHWSFWIEWYEGLLNGTPMDWDLIFKIATTLTDEDWDKGVAHVSAEIGKIRKEWDAAKTRDVEAISPEPTPAQKATAAARVAQNRDAIALAVAGLLDQLAGYRERVRGLNGLDPEYRQELLQFIDDLSGKLDELLALLPEKPAPIEPEEGGKFIKWLRECRALIPGVAKRYIEPENVVEAGVPVSIILGCTGVGAMIGGPVGAGAGGVVGSLISNQMKPGQAAKALLEDSSTQPDA